MITWFSVNIKKHIILPNDLHTPVEEVKNCGQNLFLIYNVNTYQFSNCCHRSSEVVLWKTMGFTTKELRIEFLLIYFLATWPRKTEYDLSVLWLLDLENGYSNACIMRLFATIKWENKFKTHNQLLLIFVTKGKGWERSFQGC